MTAHDQLPSELAMTIREHFQAGMRTDQLAEQFKIDPPTIRRVTRGLAKNQPLSPTDIERFWSKVDRRDTSAVCWRWRGGTSKGRGQFAAQGTTYQAHRVAYTLTTGPVPPGQVVLQRCANLLCVNPDHLMLSDPVPSEVRGEDHALARLRNAQAVAIRERYAAGGITHVALARDYGVTEATIRRVLRGHRYTSASGPRIPAQPTRHSVPHVVPQASRPEPQAQGKPRTVRAVFVASSQDIAPLVEQVKPAVPTQSVPFTAYPRPVALRDKELHRDQYHLTDGGGATLCRLSTSGAVASSSSFTFSVLQDCQRCALLVHQQKLCCPACGQRLHRVASDGRCIKCAADGVAAAQQVS